MKCAVVNSQGVVVNMIMADPEVDVPPQDCVLHAVGPDIWVDIGMNWADRVTVVQQDPPPEEII